VIREVSENTKVEKVFSFGSLVTNLEEYQGMVNSAKAAGFSDDCCEYLYLDNTSENRFDGFSGFNHLLKQANAKYLIFCHQDILFTDSDKNDLLNKIKEIERLDPHWGLLGNAGYTEFCHKAIRITDKNFDNINFGKLPQKVVSLDENFIVLNRSANIVASANMEGFHLYGIDICLNAKNFGYASYVIDFHLTHNGVGNMSKSYSDTQDKFIRILQERKKTQLLLPLCSQFFVSSSKVTTSMLNQKWLVNLYKSIAKKVKPLESL